jgi:hypothetical protein
MLWFLVAAAPLVALLVRLISLRRRPEIWWLSFTITLLGIFAGSLLLTDERAFNQFLGAPNVTYLLSCLAFIAAGGAVTIYVHTLRRATPSGKIVALITALVLAEALILILLWGMAPIHVQEVGKFRAVPLTWSLVMFEWLFHASFVPILLNVVVCTVVLARATPPGDPARRMGLLIIGVANGVDVVAHLLYLARASLQPVVGDKALVLASVADLITLVAVAGIGAGTISFLLMPQLLHSRRSFRLARTLRPLWRRALDLYPEVGMPGAWRIRARQSLQTERMLIEIADALRLLPVTSTVARDPYDAIARSLLQPQARRKPQRTALAILPVATSRLEEEEQVLELARRYKDLAHAS